MSNNFSHNVIIILAMMLFGLSIISCPLTEPHTAYSDTTLPQYKEGSNTGNPAEDSEIKAVRLTSGEWPPYLSRNMEYYGVVSRIVTEAFATQGIKVEYGFFPWQRSMALAREGDWDGSVVWIHTPEREKYFYYSDPVIKVNYVFWHLKSKPFQWDSIETLQDVTIGATWSYFYEEMFLAMEKTGRVKVEWVSEDILNFEKLLNNRIDIYPQDVYVGQYMIKHYFKPYERELLTYNPKPFKSDDLCLIMSRGNEKNKIAIQLFNTGLHQLKQSGRIEEYMREITEALASN